MNDKYLIIGGTTKAASTSIFNYLRDHPQICHSTWKETRFFLDEDYPLPARFCYKHGLDQYVQLFKECGHGTTKMEATPDYLHSPGTAPRIKKMLPQSKIVFILREPVSRLISWYRFSLQWGVVNKSAPFSEFVERQTIGNDAPSEKQWFRAMEQGLYSNYLETYFTCFGKENIFVGFFNELKESPAGFLKEICAFSDIDSDFYSDYDFKVFNKTGTQKSPLLSKAYIYGHFYAKSIAEKSNVLSTILRNAKQLVDPFYTRLNTAPDSDIEIDEKTIDYLSDYYRKDIPALENIIEKPITWKHQEDA